MSAKLKTSENYPLLLQWREAALGEDRTITNGEVEDIICDLYDRIAELERDSARLRDVGKLASIHQIIVFEKPDDNKWYWRRVGHPSEGPFDSQNAAIDAAIQAQARGTGEHDTKGGEI